MGKGILTQKRRVGGPKDIGVLKKVHEGPEKASRGSKKGQNKALKKACEPKRHLEGRKGV